MTSDRNQALAALGLAAVPDADAAMIQGAFERLARRYPEPHFPERFRRVLDARDQLLESSRGWRDFLASRTLDLTWAVPHLRATAPPVTEMPRKQPALQDLLRAGYIAEPLAPPDDGDLTY